MRIKKIGSAAAAGLLTLVVGVAGATPANAATSYGDLGACTREDRVDGEISMGLALGSVSVSYNACIEDRGKMGPRFWDVTAAGDPAPTLHGISSTLAYEAWVEPGTWHGEYSSTPTYEFVYVQQLLSLKRWGVIPVRYPMRMKLHPDRVELCIHEPGGESCEVEHYSS